jgi:SAM-dependent methyltransferase
MNKHEQEKIALLNQDKKPGLFPFVRIDELRKNPGLIDVQTEEDTDPRWGGGTVPELALRYFPKDGEIADLGAYYGRFVRYLQQHGYTHLHAMDFVDVVTQADRGNVRVQAVDFNVEPIPYPDNFFDGVSGWGFPEHLENPHHFIREVHRTLKPGGIFICSFPNVEHLQTRLVFLKTGELRSYEAHNNHIMVYSPGIFAKSFLRYFSVVEKTYMRLHFSLPPYALFRFLSRFLPNSKYFGDHVVYVLKKKPFVPYV